MFKSLEIHTWRQIERVELQFHPRLTILTGANGIGKTTILNLISTHFGWDIPLIGTPIRDQKTGVLRYFAAVWKSLVSGSKSDPQPARHIIGEITYDDGKVGALSIPENSQTFQISIAPQNPVRGLHIPSQGQLKELLRNELGKEIEKDKEYVFVSKAFLKVCCDLS